MTFEEALEAMKQGKKLYRKEWRGTEMQSIYVSRDSLFSLICDDIFSDDWEIYEEPNKDETKISNMEILHGVNVIRYILKFPSNKQALAKLDVPISHAFEIMKIAEKEAEKSIKSDPIYKYCEMGNELNSDNETKMTAGHAIEVLESIRQVTSKSVIPDIDEVIDLAIEAIDKQNQQELFFDSENLSQKELEKVQEKLKEYKLEVKTVEDADLQEEMKQTLKDKFFELAKEDITQVRADLMLAILQSMCGIYKLLYP